jgi:photosystem II stability/assembly factor-like uncharacterized protein
LIDRFDPETLYVSTFQTGQGVYASTNGGKRWRLMRARMVLPDGRPFHLQRFPGGLTLGQAIDGRLYAGGGGGWRYPAGPRPDQGRPSHRKEWEPATIGVGNIHVNTIEVDPLNPAILYQGISDRGPYKSVDQGASFHRIVGTGWPVTVDNFIWNGPYYSNYQKCRLDCSQPSEPTCEAKTKIASGGTTDFAISKQNAGIVYSSFGSGSNKSLQGGVNKSTDGGATWQPVGFQLERGFELNPETCVPYGFRRLALDPTNDSIVFAAMEIPDSHADEQQLTGKLYRTTDGGATWSEVFATTGYVTGIEVSPLDPSLVVVTTWTQVLRSERGGEQGSWQDITPSQFAGSAQGTGIQTIALSPHHAQVYVIGTRNQGIYYTADGGANWTNNRLQGFFEQKVAQDSDRYLDQTIATAYNPTARIRRDIRAIAFDPTSKDRLYVGGSQRPRASFGVAAVTHAGQNWERLSLAGLTHRNVYDLAIDARGEFLYAGTNDGTYRFKLR